MTTYKSPKDILHIELVPDFDTKVQPFEGKISVNEVLFDEYPHEGAQEAWIDVQPTHVIVIPHYYYGVIHDAAHHYRVKAEHEGKPRFKIDGDKILLFYGDFYFDEDGITIIDWGRP
jgi:hypothetical protein